MFLKEAAGCGERKGHIAVKIMITQEEAMQRKIWDQVIQMFGLDADKDYWQNEQFILTEEQARQLGLIR